MVLGFKFELVFNVSLNWDFFVVTEALQLMLERVHLPENDAKISAAKEEAGDDMVEVMQRVFPIVLGIQVCAQLIVGFRNW